MIKIRNFLKRNAVYMFCAFFTAITVKTDAELPQPLPFVYAYACTSSHYASLQINVGVANFSYITSKHIGMVFSGMATGSTETDHIHSEEAVQENGETVWQPIEGEHIFVEIVNGANTSSSGITGGAHGIGIGSETGTETVVPQIDGNPAGLEDWFSMRSHSSSSCSGNLDSDTDSSTAHYYSFWVIGFAACDNVTTN